jgi:hypothetical protein
MEGKAWVSEREDSKLVHEGAACLVFSSCVEFLGLPWQNGVFIIKSHELEYEIRLGGGILGYDNFR